MSNGKHIAVICNYELMPERIGGMDRFFVAYDIACKEKGYQVDWYFSNCQSHSFYENLKIYASGGVSAENQFLLNTGNTMVYNLIVTHFIQFCTPFFKKIKKNHQAYIIAVDHNPRPLKGFTLKKRIKNKIKGLMYGKFINCFVGVSKYTVAAILSDYGKSVKGKTVLVYNGIKTSLYKQREYENRGRMIVASHLRASKGIQDLIEAVNILPEENKKQLSVDVFGEGPLEVDLKLKVNQYHLEQQFKFHGSSSELPSLFCNYSFLLQPTYMECFSLSILESLAANVPVITTPVGGNLEIVKEGKNGFIVEAGNVKALSSILQNVLQGNMQIQHNVSHQIQEQFTLEKMVNEHVKLLPCI